MNARALRVFFHKAGLIKRGDGEMRAFWIAFCVFLFAGTLQAQITITNVKVDDAFVFPGALITAQIVEIKVPTGQSLTITSVSVKNTATGAKVAGGDLEYIEIRRGSATGPVLKKETSLSGFETAGVTIATTANNTFTAGTYKLYILTKLKPVETLVGKALQLGETKVNTVPVTYPSAAPAATFTVVGPEVNFAEEPVSGVVYRGQRFLAARLIVNAGAVPLDFTITQVSVSNTASDPKLSGRYVSRIEVRRAEDGALLGEQTSSSELEKLTTSGTIIPTTANNRVAAYSTTALEIWITLKSDAPTGHKVKLDVVLRCESGNFSAKETPPEFTVQAGLGFESAQATDLPNKGVVPGETFVAQRLRLRDDDADPYDVTLTSILVKNMPEESPLSEQHFAKIEIKRRADGAVLGSTTDVSGLNSTGVRIPLTANNVISDDTEVQVELYVTLNDSAPLDRRIKLVSRIWYNEGGASLATDPLEGPATFTVIGPQGLETIENRTTAPADRNIFPGQTFLAQKIYLEDADDDPYGVTIARVLVKNLSATSPLLDAHVAKIEVRDSAGKLLGETSSISGLTTSGVWISTTANNTIADNKNLTIEIWVSLKGDVPVGRKFTAGARVQHTEGWKHFCQARELSFLQRGVHHRRRPWEDREFHLFTGATKMERRNHFHSLSQSNHGHHLCPLGFWGRPRGSPAGR